MTYHMVDFVHTDESRRELEHVVPQGDDDKLGVLRPLFDVCGDDGDLYHHPSA